MRIDTFQNGSNFAKLNINDIDATNSIFDPESQGNHFVYPNTVGTTYNDMLNDAKRIYGSFSKGSSSNDLPRRISMSIIGLPQDIDKALNLNSISNYNINFGNDGLTMSLQYSDTPERMPSMDYLQSRLHNQFHYVTMNKFHS